MREPPVARRVLVPGRQFDFGAADWEARGEVPPRHVATRAYELDAYELTEPGDDPARAASGLDRDEARAACAARGGRLPTDDEWLAAAALHRYPWGDTGLVCRRAAWGLEHGPCARGATTPDTVGAHPDGQSADGVFDLTGNVAEWVETASGRRAGARRQLRRRLCRKLAQLVFAGGEPHRTRRPRGRALRVRCGAEGVTACRP